jgi:hypothetical protein
MHFTAAGDPRQEVYEGATWFSNLWATTPAANKMTLNFNHRSTSTVVNMLNKFSEANFPTLHYEQQPTREGGRFEVHVVGDADIGQKVGELISEYAPTDVYGVVPVSTGFWTEADTKQAQVTIYNNRPGTYATSEPVHCSGGTMNKSDDYPSNAYLLATAKRIKGTERHRVVIYGADRDYSNINRSSMIKNLFVALSRGRDEVILVMRELPKGAAVDALRPILEGKIITPIVREIERPTLYNPELCVTARDTDECGLCSSAISVTSEPLATTFTPLETLSRGDSDFIGMYVESLIAQQLGIDVTPRDAKVRLATYSALYRDNGVDVVSTTNYGGKKLTALREFIQHLDISDGAYARSVLHFSTVSDRFWNVSERVADTLETSQVANFIANTIVDDNPDVTYQPLKSISFAAHRSTAVVATIVGVPDFIINGIPIEIKCVNAITDHHRRQTAIYAALCNAEKGLLVNAKGSAEWIAAMPMKTLELTAMAYAAVVYARKVSVKLAKFAITRPQMENIVIVVDTESLPPAFNCSATESIVEIGAIAIDITTWNVVGVFHEIAPGVREITADDIEENRSKGFDLRTMSEELILLRRDTKSTTANTITTNFRTWVSSISTMRTFIHWGGSEAKLCGKLGKAIDLRQNGFLPWLMHKGEQRKDFTSLSDAALQIIPHYKFIPHRAFNDALVTMTILLCIFDAQSVL